ncbi:MAG: SprT-like domain-containing protein [Pseudomonas sp.]
MRVRCIEVVDQARTIYPLDGLKVFLRCDLRGRCAGKAMLRRKEREGVIRLNPEAYALDPAEMLSDTIPHEVAHLVAGFTGLGRGHDAGWRRIAIALGSSGRRCHDLDLTPARRTTRHLYRSTCGATVPVGPVAHKKIQAGAVYKMRKTAGHILRDGYQGPQRT